jgi:hypothetical protein
MTHPFFDAVRYPVDRPEARFLHRVLLDAVLDPRQINNIYQECDPDLPPLTLNQSPDLIWWDALQNLTVQGALRQLLSKIQQRFKSNNTIKNAIREIENAQPASEQQIISHGRLMLDRVTLRQQLNLMGAEIAPLKVLLVRGDAGSGKTYSSHLFELAARDNGAISVYLCDGMVVTVDDVIQQLFSALEALERIPPRDTTTEAWYRIVCVKLQEEASKKNRPVWITVDDLGPTEDGAPLLDPEIRKFCDQFALNMVNPFFRKWFRLMLIHYPDGSVPTRWRRDFWSEDRTNERDVQQPHVVELLRSWSVAHDHKIIEDELTSLAAEVVAKADAPVAPSMGASSSLPRLQRIHDALTEMLRDLERRAP